jgi:hypothetical protein
MLLTEMHRQVLLNRTQINHQFLQPLIFILQLLQTSQSRHNRTGKFLLPVVKDDLRNIHLSAKFPDTSADLAYFSAHVICSSV